MASDFEKGSERPNKAGIGAVLVHKLYFLWNPNIFKDSTHRDDPRDDHYNGEDKTDDKHISFAVERTILVLKIYLELKLATFVTSYLPWLSDHQNDEQ